ncbi:MULTISPECIES: hypothetical protein [Corallococcus]|uniref:hypothetical protein n=1 Tax=Corallococcus TaxID=83461 RepID=UPI0011C3C163|nr:MULTISPECIES: hypothetical protein [Corallococcus]
MAQTILPVKWGKIEQGSIFSGALSEDYKGCDIHGLIITARCDLAHDKTQIFNYLPIAKMQDWIDRDFKSIVCQRWMNEIEGNLRSTLNTAGHSPNILTTEPLASIIEKLFPADAADKKTKTARDRLEKINSTILKLEKINKENKLKPFLPPDDKSFASICRQALDDCIRQKLSGYYFLDSISPDGDKHGYVALLREVRHLPRNLAIKIAAGIEKPEYELHCRHHPEAANKICFDSTDFAFPIGVLRSPEIEHLLQSFSLLFSRIGLTDPETTYIDKLKEHHSISTKEES